ncbi:hypothetical protein H8356DRAFT_1340782 [Neocallimastix lanati (nom. inval.)]|nr:hypothetical protein H8356DRAFT_1340782 [Neocallimastix sp. JGI-2020a]
MSQTQALEKKHIQNNAKNVKFTFYSLPVFQISLFVLEAALERITIDYHQNHRKLLFLFHQPSMDLEKHACTNYNGICITTDSCQKYNRIICVSCFNLINSSIFQRCDSQKEYPFCKLYTESPSSKNLKESRTANTFLITL